MRVSLVVSFHITTAVAVTLLNKAVLNILPVPVLLLLCQSIISLTLILVSVAFARYTPPKLDRDLIQRVGPIVGMKIIAQLSKTYCLLNVNASFYQIARGLLLPFTIIMSILLLSNSRPNVLAFVACGITTLGFVWGLEGEKLGQTTGPGMAWGVWSSLTTALETVVIKLFATEAGVLDIVYLTSLATIPVYAALATATGDLAILTALSLNDKVVFDFVGVLAASGLFNFALSVAAYLQIAITSPITHMISSSARGVLQSLLAVGLLKHERLTSSRTFSMITILMGTISYTLSKEIEKRRQVAAKDSLPLHNSMFDIETQELYQEKRDSHPEQQSR